MLLNLPDSRIHEVLLKVDLQNTGRKRSAQFSMGMKQRLGIAIALLNNPKLLILDEPTNGFDPIGIQELRELIRTRSRRVFTSAYCQMIHAKILLVSITNPSNAEDL